MSTKELGTAIFAVIAGALLLLSGPGCTAKPCGSKLITAVGGCDRDGNCGVRYTDGSFGTRLYPVPGKAVDVCR